MHKTLTVSKQCKICKRIVVANGVKLQRYVTETPRNDHYCSRVCCLKDPKIWKE